MAEESPEDEVTFIRQVEQIAVPQQDTGFFQNVLLFGDPGEGIGIAADYIKFMIADNKADFELLFRFPAPLQETGMDI